MNGKSAGRVASVFTALILGLSGIGPAGAAEDDEWSLVVTPQVWFTHIPDNGFAPPPAPINFRFNPHLVTIASQPTQALVPQWGAQVAAQKGPWTLGVAAQYVSFETRNDINAAVPLFAPGLSIRPGQTIVQEFVNTDRFDFDLSLSYFLPDVVKDMLDINAGLGFKFIYASASRNFNNGIAFTDPLGQVRPTQGYFYLQDCPRVFQFAALFTGGTSCQFRDRVSVDDFYYGLTIPLSFGFRPFSNKRWVLPINVSPFIGAETRDDHDVVYAAKSIAGNPNVNPTLQVQKLDGTTFAYGATADVGARYVFDNGVALYGGFRVQFFEGFQQYLAWGPVINMSVRFGK